MLFNSSTHCPLADRLLGFHQQRPADETSEVVRRCFQRDIEHFGYAL